MQQPYSDTDKDQQHGMPLAALLLPLYLHRVTIRSIQLSGVELDVRLILHGLLTESTVRTSTPRYGDVQRTLHVTGLVS